MAHDARPNYQVVASGQGEEAGHVLRARIGLEPILVGSGDSVDLKLDGELILEAHARVLVTSSGDVILINLGAPETMLLSGEAMASFKPAYWKPGVPALIGDYELQLVALDIEGENGRLERVRPALITQDNEPVSQSAPRFVIDWSNRQPADSSETSDKESLTNKETGLFSDKNDEGAPASKATLLFSKEDDEDNLSDEKSASHSEESETRRPSLVETAGTDKPDEKVSDVDLGNVQEPNQSEFSRTPDMPFDFAKRTVASSYSSGPSNIPSNSAGRPFVSETLPKDWQQLGQLSAQAVINPIALVAGERVRVPISIRNEYEYPVHLRVYVAGLTRDEIIMPEKPLEIGAGEVRSFDLILQPKVPAENGFVDLVLRLRDPASPDVVLALPLHIIFKAAPNIAGWLDPAVIHNSKLTYLYLQNHTRGATTVFIGSHMEAREINIVPDYTKVDVLPGQIVKVPIHIHILERSLLRPKQAVFSITARQGTRAPLDFPGTVQIKPRVPVVVAVLLVVILLLGGAVIALRQITTQSTLSNILTQTPVSSELGATGHPTVQSTEIPVTSEALPTFTDTPTATETHMATNTPAATPTTIPTTEVAFEDPRPEDCTVPIPPGWEPYVVRSGDRAFRLAIDHGTTVEEIAAVNCLQNPSLLRVGQVLLLPPQP